MILKTEAERIASLETLVDIIREEQKETNRKLDELLTLRNKGAGIFWLITILVGTGIFGILSNILTWAKG